MAYLPVREVMANLSTMATEQGKTGIWIRAELEARGWKPDDLSFDAVKYPRTAYRDDVEDSVAAQRQRRKQGDHHTGKDDEARGKLGLPKLEDEFRRGVR